MCLSFDLMIFVVCSFILLSTDSYIYMNKYLLLLFWVYIFQFAVLNFFDFDYSIIFNYLFFTHIYSDLLPVSYDYFLFTE